MATKAKKLSIETDVVPPTTVDQLIRTAAVIKIQKSIKRKIRKIYTNPDKLLKHKAEFDQLVADFLDCNNKINEILMECK